MEKYGDDSNSDSNSGSDKKSDQKRKRDLKNDEKQPKIENFENEDDYWIALRK